VGGELSGPPTARGPEAGGDRQRRPVEARPAPSGAPHLADSLAREPPAAPVRAGSPRVCRVARCLGPRPDSTEVCPAEVLEVGLSIAVLLPDGLGRDDQPTADPDRGELSGSNGPGQPSPGGQGLPD